MSDSSMKQRILTATHKNPRSTPIEIAYYLEQKLPGSFSFKEFTRAWDWLIDNDFFAMQGVVSIRTTLDDSIKRLKEMETTK